MPRVDDALPFHYWRPASCPDVYLVRAERQQRGRTTYSEHYAVVAVYGGVFEGWYRGAVHSCVAGHLKLKEPGEVHRRGQVFEPFSIQVAGLTPALVERAATALGLRGPIHFRVATLGPDAPATARAFAMHAALARPETTPLEAGTLVTEAVSEILLTCAENGASPPVRRETLAVRRARDFLRGTLAEKVTLDALAAHAGLDKFHLVRAFRAEVGLPPYEYLTHLRVARAAALLTGGALVAEAAQAVGLYDESQLHRHFRRILGTTPGRFARQLAAPGPARSLTSWSAGRRATRRWTPADMANLAAR